MSTYYVYAVHYDSTHSHIEQLKVAQSAGGFQYLSRQDVVNRIYHRTDEFITAVLLNNGQYAPGAKVIIEQVNGGYYLKTVADRTTRDNLSQLPTY